MSCTDPQSFFMAMQSISCVSPGQSGEAGSIAGATRTTSEGKVYMQAIHIERVHALHHRNTPTPALSRAHLCAPAPTSERMKTPTCTCMHASHPALPVPGGGSAVNCVSVQPLVQLHLPGRCCSVQAPQPRHPHFVHVLQGQSQSLRGR